MFSVIVLGNVFHEPTVLLAQKNDFSNDTENLGISEMRRELGEVEKSLRDRGGEETAAPGE